MRGKPFWGTGLVTPDLAETIYRNGFQKLYIAILLNISYKGHVHLIPAWIYIIAKLIQYSNNACFLEL